MYMSFHEGVPHRAGNAKNEEAKWRLESAVKLSADYSKVQDELKKLEDELNRNIDGVISAKEQTPEERESRMQTNRKISQRIDELEQEKAGLAFAIRKAGGNPEDPTVQ